MANNSLRSILNKNLIKLYLYWLENDKLASMLVLRENVPSIAPSDINEKIETHVFFLCPVRRLV